MWLLELALWPGEEDPFKEDWEAWLSEPLQIVSVWTFVEHSNLRSEQSEHSNLRSQYQYSRLPELVNSELVKLQSLVNERPTPDQPNDRGACSLGPPASVKLQPLVNRPLTPDRFTNTGSLLYAWCRSSWSNIPDRIGDRPERIRDHQVFQIQTWNAGERTEEKSVGTLVAQRS